MFENIIEQNCVTQLRLDVLSGRNAPSNLFYGPSGTGKTSAAIEFARVLSCEKDASWNCACSSCAKHRFLQSDDLLILGKKPFGAEINACHSVLLQNISSKSAKLLFIRSARKLLLRFSPIFIEDDPKLGKLIPVIQAMDEELSEFQTMNAQAGQRAVLEKLSSSLVKNAAALEGGIADLIPAGHIRNAAYWCRITPNGRHKTLIIENAESTRGEGSNSLLKLLEEPPSNVSIVLTSQRREVLIPTILSRLRQYRFLKRSAEGEKEILRRIFQVSNGCHESVCGFLGSFLPVNDEKLDSLAAWFACSAARLIITHFRNSGKDEIPPVFAAIEERYAQESGNLKYGQFQDSENIIRILLEISCGFEDGSFLRFLKLCLEKTALVFRETGGPECVLYADIFNKYFNEALNNVEVYNQSCTLALEALLFNLKNAALKREKI